MNILFTCAGRRVALLEAFRRALAELGVPGRLIAADLTAASAAWHKADLGLAVPRADSEAYVPALLEAVRRHRVGLLVPLTDLDLLPLARRRDEFTAAGCTVMVGSEDAVATCRDKARFAARLEAAGVPTVTTCTLEQFRARPFYPCFVKPLRGSAGVGAAAVRDDTQLAAHVAAHGEGLVVQQCAAGQEFTIDVFRTRAGRVACAVPRQRLAVRSGEVEKGITVADGALIDAAVGLADALDGLWGVFCCQCRRGEDGVARFFEVNARFGGGAPLAIAAGANLPLYLLQEVLGLPVTAELGKFADRLLMLRYDEAVYVRVDDPSALPGHDTPSFR